MSSPVSSTPPAGAAPAGAAKADKKASSTTTEASSPEQKKPVRPSTTLHKKISSKRLVGRLPVSPSPTSSASQSRVSLVSNQWLQQEQEGQSGASEYEDAQTSQLTNTQQNAANRHHSHLSSTGANLTKLLEQLKDWAHSERERQGSRRARKTAKGIKRRASQKTETPSSATARGIEGLDGSVSPVSSGDEAEKAAMDAFDAILAAAEASNTERRPSVPRRNSRLRSRAKPFKGGHTSDTDYASDGEALVPSCEEMLQTVEDVGLDEFKNQILKLAHTLRCKGWRSVPLDRYKEVNVEKISGALTNAVFMVTPPSEILLVVNNQDPQSNAGSPGPMKMPAKLLLRIYGAQATHLIDRENELSILRRLARKRIGPRLLGIFENGRFEEFFPSRTLARSDIRNPETSRHIAKRLKELHEGIELGEEEIQRGPVAWLNWDKWIPRARGIIAITEANNRKSGPVVGTSWEKFERTVEKYREWLNERYGGVDGVKKQLIFAHNDTQYGNILRLQADGKSPLLLPMNEHRQLVVIDFEYASANPPGFEFGNHFCEWMANYHDPDASHIMREAHYPNLDQQRNFLRAYAEHHLRGGYSTKTPSTSTLDLTQSSLDVRTPTPFSLDARTPVPPYKEEADQIMVGKEVDRLIEEALVWRAASHAMWCIWGILRAKLAPLDTKQKEQISEEAGNVPDDMEDRKDEEDEDFDYLGYAQQRALLFWGDMLKLEIIKLGDVDEFVLENMKRIEW